LPAFIFQAFFAIDCWSFFFFHTFSMIFFLSPPNNLFFQSFFCYGTSLAAACPSAAGVSLHEGDKRSTCVVPVSFVGECPFFRKRHSFFGRLSSFYFFASFVFLLHDGEFPPLVYPTARPFHAGRTSRFASSISCPVAPLKGPLVEWVPVFLAGFFVTFFIFLSQSPRPFLLIFFPDPISLSFPVPPSPGVRFRGRAPLMAQIAVRSPSLSTPSTP